MSLLRCIMAANPVATVNTLNPSDKNSGLTLSGGNLVVSYSGSNGSLRAIRGTKGCSSGIHSFDAAINAGTFQLVGVATKGVADISSVTYYPGIDLNGYGYEQSSGKEYRNATANNYGAIYASGDVIRAEIDFGAGTISFYKNGVSQGVAFVGIAAGIYYPCVAIPNNGGQITVDLTNW